MAVLTDMRDVPPPPLADPDDATMPTIPTTVAVWACALYILGKPIYSSFPFA